MSTFTATIHKIWVMRCADVPADVFHALGGGRTIPVLATYGGQTHEPTVPPGGAGLGRLTLRADCLRAAGLDVGDPVEVSLEHDPVSREPDVPDDLRRALAFRPDARAAFEKLTPAGRRQAVIYLDKARREETRSGLVERLVERLAEGPPKKPPARPRR